MSQRESEVNPENKHRYWKLHRIDFSERYYNVWGIITEFSFKKSYDSRYVEQDEFRFKIQMFISKPAVDVTIYSDVGLIPQSEFVIGRCIRLHRLSVAKFRATGSFYLRGRLNRPVSLLIVDVTDVKAEKVDVKYYSGDRKKLKLDVVDENVLFSFLAPLLTQMKKSKTSHVDDFDSSVNDDDYAAGTRVKIEAADDVEDEADGAAVIEQPNNDEGDARNTQNAAPTPVATDDVEDLVEQVAAEENARATIRTPRKVVEFVSPAAPQTPMRYSRDPRRRLLDREPSPDTPMRTPKAQPSQLTQRNVPPRSLDECIANYNGKKVVRFKDTLAGAYFNIACQIVTFYSGRSYGLLRVWDGSRTPFLTKTYKIDELKASNFDFMYGDKKLERRLQSENLIYDIYCWNEHAIDAAQLQKGNYIILVNCHKVTRAGSSPCFTLHGNNPANTKYVTSITKIEKTKVLYGVMERQIADSLKELPEYSEDEEELSSQSPKKSPVKNVEVQTENGDKYRITGYNQKLKIAIVSPAIERQDDQNDLQEEEQAEQIDVNEESAEENVGFSQESDNNDEQDDLNTRRGAKRRLVEEMDESHSEDEPANTAEDNNEVMDFTYFIDKRIESSQKKKIDPESQKKKIKVEPESYPLIL